MTKEEAIYILRNTAFLAPSLEPIDEAIEMACEALKQADTPQTENVVGNKATLTIKDEVVKVTPQTDCPWK